MAGKVEVKFDDSDLEEFLADMVKFYTKEYPRETKNFLQRCGNKLKKELRANTKSLIQNQVTGNLAAASNYTRGRAEKKGDEFQVRVRNKAPHAYWFEHGHEIFTYSRAEGKAVDRGRKTEGRHPAAKTKKEFEPVFVSETEKWVDEMLGLL